MLFLVLVSPHVVLKTEQVFSCFLGPSSKAPPSPLLLESFTRSHPALQGDRSRW